MSLPQIQIKLNLYDSFRRHFLATVKALVWENMKAEGNDKRSMQERLTFMALEWGGSGGDGGAGGHTSGGVKDKGCLVVLCGWVRCGLKLLVTALYTQPRARPPTRRLPRSRRHFAGLANHQSCFTLSFDIYLSPHLKCIARACVYFF